MHEPLTPTQDPASRESPKPVHYMIPWSKILVPSQPGMSFAALADKKSSIDMVVITVRWGDMGDMGHVNNSSCFRYLNAARHD